MRKFGHERESTSLIISWKVIFVLNTKAYATFEVTSMNLCMFLILMAGLYRIWSSLRPCSSDNDVLSSDQTILRRIFIKWTMQREESGSKGLNVPKTITCRITSLEIVKALTTLLPWKGYVEQPKLIEQDLEQPSWTGNGSSLVLAGLHACGDLPVTVPKWASKYASPYCRSNPQIGHLAYGTTKPSQSQWKT